MLCGERIRSLLVSAVGGDDFRVLSQCRRGRHPGIRMPAGPYKCPTDSQFNTPFLVFIQAPL